MKLFEHIDKRVVIGFGVVLVVLLAWFFYTLGGTEEVDGPITILPVSPLDATLGSELLAALAKLQSTTLDTSVFEDPVFSSLKDFGVEIAAQPVGRRNPFADFGVSAPSKTTEGSVKVPVSGGASLKPTIPEGFDIE